MMKLSNIWPAVAMPAVCALVLTLAAPADATLGVDPIRQTRATSPANSELQKMSALEQVSALARCVKITDTETYCLGLGFMEHTPDYRELARSAAVPDGFTTGAQSVGSWLAERLAMSDAAREEAEVETIKSAMLSAGKERRLRQQLAWVAAKSAGTSTAGLEPPPQTPVARRIMDTRAIRQARSYWCGPATMTSLDWGDNGQKATQATWASRLGTTTRGTSIENMVRGTNRYTNWDLAAGRYHVRSVSGLNTEQFYWLHRIQVGARRPAPVIEHPQLLARYFHYIRYNASGHFNVGRGYYRRTTGERTLQLLEVYNEADWKAGGRVSWGPREIFARDLREATQQHPRRNVGV